MRFLKKKSRWMSQNAKVLSLFFYLLFYSHVLITSYLVWKNRLRSFGRLTLEKEFARLILFVQSAEAIR